MKEKIFTFTVTSIIFLLAIGYVYTRVAGIKLDNEKKPNNDLVSVNSINSKDKANGVYEWRDFRKFDYGSYKGDLQKLSDRGFNRIYLSLNYYIDFIEDSDSTDKDKKKQEYTNNLKYFINTANDFGFQVEGLAGNYNWSESDYQYLNDIILDFVNEYNNTTDIDLRLRGIQYDIEPYSQANFDQNSEAYYQNYLLTVDRIYKNKNLKNTGGLDIPIGFVIPFWLDNGERVKEIDFNGSKKAPAYHILDLANQYNGNVTIMAYRNEIYGLDGIEKSVRNELEYATRYTNLKILLAQETKNVMPSKITYFNKSIDDLINNINILSSDEGYKTLKDGVVINDTEGLLQLINK